MFLLIILGALLAIVGLLAFTFVRQLCAASGRQQVTAEWIDNLSPDRYRPMLRLLDERDFDFLRSEPGRTAGLLSKVRRQRRQLFCAYLRDLESDFNGVCSAVKMMMLQSRHDRADLAATLLRTQSTFAYRMLLVRCRLAAHRVGLSSVKVEDLIKLLDGMRVELQTLVPASAGSMA